MIAMILAAGLGTRLYPHTADKPKALVELNSKPLIKHVIEHLATYGYNEFVVNVHHFGEKIIEYLGQEQFRNFKIHISDERNELLNTGGAIWKARNILANYQNILVVNTDIISNLNLELLRAYHKEQDGIATLVVRNRETQRFLLFNNKMELAGWKNSKTEEYKWGQPSNSKGIIKAYPFSGIQIITNEYLEKMTREGAFSSIDQYLDLCGREKIVGYLDNSSMWSDIGKIDELKKMENIYGQQGEFPSSSF
ncbi:MAG: sugar phosphate nucleotidyltransferase [Bacteroidales bacterium]